MRADLFEVFEVPTGSMRPTLSPGDRLLVNKAIYAREPLCRGDVVVVRNPDRPRQFFVKRVVALPDDKVTFDGPDVRVEPAPVEPTPVGDRAGRSVVVPHGAFYVLGDDRDGAVDSRRFGPVPITNLVGRVTHVFFPRVATIAAGKCPAPHD